MKKYIVSGFLALSIIVPVLAGAQRTDVNPNGGTSACVSLQNNLSYRSRDASTNGEVSTLQDFLQGQNLLSTDPTGYFGLLTVRAVESFQAANSITPNGFVGPITRAKISAVTCINSTTTYTPPSNPTNLPNGCRTSSGFSSTTGMSCGTTTPNTINSYISVLTPAGGEMYSLGQSFNIRWTGTDANWANHDLWLLDNRSGGTGQKTFIGTATADTSKDVQSFYWTIPSNISSGFGYQIQFGNIAVGFSGAFGINATTTTMITPTVSLSANPTIVSPGFSSTLSWNAINATSCLTPGNVKDLSSTSGSVVVTPTQTTTYYVTCYNGVSVNGSNPPSSTQNITVTVTRGVFLPGCTSNQGWSTITGESCLNDLPPAGVQTPIISYLQGAGCTSIMGTKAVSGDLCSATVPGGTVYVFGKNFTSDAQIFLGDGRLSAISSFISSTSLSFQVPLSLGGEPSIYVNIERNGKSYISNSVALPLQSSVCSSSGYNPTTGLLCGCSSTSGWSATTGQSCGIQLYGGGVVY